MGLYVIAFEALKLLKPATIEEANAGELYDQYDRSGVTYLYRNRSFEAQAEGMVDGFYEHCDEIEEGYSGSYGGYGDWRAQLAKLIGTTTTALWKDPKPGPFVELINFADNEGFIGPKTSAKLAADFREWAGRAEAAGGAFFRVYCGFRKAFEFASRGGAVKFH